MVTDPRDRIYIRRDIILMLSEYGELNQTKLISYCGLNMKKHKEILQDMETKGLLRTAQEPWGSRTIVKYKVTHKGLEFYRMVLEPYEDMFSRSTASKGKKQ